MNSFFRKTGKVVLASLVSLSSLTFVKATTIYSPGATVVKDENSPSGYTVHFIYDARNEEKSIESIQVSGPFRYVDASQDLKDDTNSYTPDQYKNGMYATNCAPGSKTSIMEMTWGYAQELTDVDGDKIYETSFPITSGAFGYHYEIKYTGEEKSVTIADPANLPEKLDSDEYLDTGDKNTSIVYGHWDDEKQSNSPNMDYVLPVENEADKGSLKYESYPDIEGNTSRIGIYTPAGYDANREEPYKVIYISHGAGGDHTDWFHMGSIDNVMDNYVAQGKAEPAIIVTMNNTHFGWDTSKTLPNVVEKIIPYMESNYNVSTESKDRAMVGLSAGGMTTTNMYWTYPDVFGYFGIFSGTSVGDAVEWKEAYAYPTIMATVGTCDFASSVIAGGESAFTVETFDKWAKNNIPDTYVTDDIYVKGSHDWFEWPQSFAMFIGDVAWSNEPSTYNLGVTVEKNTDSRYVAPYQATFVYEDTDVRNAVKVTVSGNFQFYKEDEVKNYDASGDNSAIPSYNVYEYEEGMFNSGYGINGDSGVYELTQTEGERFELTIPLPGNLYYYDYTVTYADGSTETIKDPVNLPVANATTGHDSGHSLFYVGDSTSTIKGQEYIYERTDGKTGTYSFVEYTAVDGTKQPLGVYLPYGYDVQSGKTYKTIYVSHGGGGNETEWMEIGAIPHIMDNLIAEGLTDEAIVVTMDNSYFGWDYDKIVPNVIEHIIPYIEEHYAVSTKANDRAFSGLSMGSMTTNTMMKEVPNEFGYFGAFSGGNQDLDPTHYDADALNNSILYLTAGSIDMAYNNKMGISSVDYMSMLDSIGVKYNWELKNGAHDWGVWRDSFTTFAKDYLWTKEEVVPTPEPTPIPTPTPDKKDDTVITPSTDTAVKKAQTNVNTGDTTPSVIGFAGLSMVALVASAYLVSKKRK